MRRIGLWAVLVVAALALGGSLSYRPWQAYLEQKRIASRHRQQMEEAEAKRADLIREKVRLESRAGREAAAREHNYVRPGESSPP